MTLTEQYMATLSTHLIGARVWDVDDSCCQFGLQIVYESCSEDLGLTPDIILVSPTRHRQQQAELTVALTQKRFCLVIQF